MLRPGRDESYNLLVAPYLAATFILSFASILYMRPKASDTSEPELTHLPPPTMESIPRTWSGVCALFETWTGKAHDSNSCTKQELDRLKRDMHRVIAEKQKVCSAFSSESLYNIYETVVMEPEL